VAHHDQDAALRRRGRWRRQHWALARKTAPLRAFQVTLGCCGASAARACAASCARRAGRRACRAGSARRVPNPFSRFIPAHAHRYSGKRGAKAAVHSPSLESSVMAKRKKATKKATKKKTKKARKKK
jgi:hypothetical protein